MSDRSTTRWIDVDLRGLHRCPHGYPLGQAQVGQGHGGDLGGDVERLVEQDPGPVSHQVHLGYPRPPSIAWTSRWLLEVEGDITRGDDRQHRPLGRLCHDEGHSVVHDELRSRGESPDEVDSHEFCDVARAGSGRHLLEGSLLHHETGLDDHQPIGDGSSVQRVVRDQYTRALKLRELLSELVADRPAAATSSAAMGSSSSRSLGRVARARARATRWACPPESCAGLDSDRSANPDPRQPLERLTIGLRFGSPTAP